MARLDEIFDGVASVLAFSIQPEPLPISFSDHSPTEIAFLVRAVIAGCERAGYPLAYVRLPAAVATILLRDPEPIRGVRLGDTMAQPDAVEFGRFPLLS